MGVRRIPAYSVELCEKSVMYDKNLPFAGTGMKIEAGGGHVPWGSCARSSCISLEEMRNDGYVIIRTIF